MSQHATTVSVMQNARLFERIRRGDTANASFADLVRLLRALGFQEVGGRGSHRVFASDGVTELLNLQEDKGQAKRYQVRQIAAVVRRYNLQLEDER